MKKKYYFIILFLCFFQTSKAVSILQITVSALNSTDINIHTKVGDGYYFEYYSHNYQIVDKTITLNICYHPYMTSVVTYKENDFVIPNINIDPINYTLVVNISKRMYVGSTWVCNSPIDTDTETLAFSTPLNAVVNLSSNAFNEPNNNNNTSLYPNPTNGTVNISTENEIKIIEVYDHLARKVKTFSILSNYAVDMSNLEDGIYFIKLSTDKADTTRKIILKK